MVKGRRAIVVRMIDQCREGAVRGHFFERKAALLAKEDQIESEFEAMVGTWHGWLDCCLAVSSETKACLLLIFFTG